MTNNLKTNTCTYIIAYKARDTIIASLRELLDTQLQHCQAVGDYSLFLQDPFEIHSLISSLSMEAAKFHVKRFQRFMWAQVCS